MECIISNRKVLISYKQSFLLHFNEEADLCSFCPHLKDAFLDHFAFLGLLTCQWSHRGNVFLMTCHCLPTEKSEIG